MHIENDEIVFSSPGGSAPAAISTLVRRPGCGAEVLLPNTGVITIVAGTPIWVFSAWTAEEPISATDRFINGLYLSRETVPGATRDSGVEWGYGAGPTSIAFFRNTFIIVDPALDDVGRVVYHVNAFNAKIPAGNALQARVSDGVGAATWKVWATAWDTAVPTFTPLGVDISTGATRYYPTNISAGLLVPMAALPAFGAWTTVVDPAPNDMVVMDVSLGSAAAGVISPSDAFQIGIGAAGSEQALATVVVLHTFHTNAIQPPVWVKAGERLAIRGAALGAGNRNVLVQVADL